MVNRGFVKRVRKRLRTTASGSVGKKRARTKAQLKKDLMKTLAAAPVTGVHFTKRKITLNYMGKRITDEIIIDRERHVAEWSRRRKQIILDRNLSGFDRETSFRALCVHEVVEKFVAEKYGLHVDTEAHFVAAKKEEEYVKAHGGNWRSHELIVYWDWHNLGEKG
jgi:hypothetical protein